MKQAPLLHPLEYAVYKALRLAVRVLPHEFNRSLGSKLGGLSYSVLRSRRKTALANLALALPELPKQRHHAIARASFAHLGAHLLDTLSAARFTAQQFCSRLEIEGWQNLLDAEARGKGVFLMSAHLGAWEAAALPVGLYRGSFDIVNRPLDNPLLNQELLNLRQRFGNTMIDKRGATRKMLASLKKQGRVGILIDQRVPPNQGETVDFFSHPANTSQGLARMALKSHVPVVPIFGFLAPNGGYKVVFGSIIEPEAEGEDAVKAQTKRYLEAVEAEVRRRPDQWLWMHDRWGLAREAKLRRTQRP